MRADVPAYSLERPASLADALARIADAPGRWRPFAGGTDLMVVFEAGRLEHREFLDLSRLAELRGTSEDETWLTFGASTTYREVIGTALARLEFPMLVAAARDTGAVAIQARGTLGGNLANASPAADTPPALLCYGAQVELVSRGGARWVPYEGFHQAYKKTQMRPDELISRIRVRRRGAGPGPRPAGGIAAAREHHFYRKVGTRKAQAISKVCFAGWASLNADGSLLDARIALGAVAPTPVRAFKAEIALRARGLGDAGLAEARDALAAEIQPIDDIRSVAEYRRAVALNLLEEFVGRLRSPS